MVQLTKEEVDNLLIFLNRATTRGVSEAKVYLYLVEKLAKARGSEEQCQQDMEMKEKDIQEKSMNKI